MLPRNIEKRMGEVENQGWIETIQTKTLIRSSGILKSDQMTCEVIQTYMKHHHLKYVWQTGSNNKTNNHIIRGMEQINTEGGYD